MTKRTGRANVLIREPENDIYIKYWFCLAFSSHSADLVVNWNWYFRFALTSLFTHRLTAWTVSSGALKNLCLDQKTKRIRVSLLIPECTLATPRSFKWMASWRAISGSSFHRAAEIQMTLMDDIDGMTLMESLMSWHRFGIWWRGRWAISFNCSIGIPVSDDEYRCVK